MSVDPNNPYLKYVTPEAAAPAISGDNPYLKYVQPQAEPGLADTLKNNFNQSAYNQGMISGNDTLNPVEKVIQATGEGAGLVARDVNSVAKSAVNVLPEKFRTAVSNAAKKTGEDFALGIPAKILSGAGDVASGLYSEAEKINPNLTHDVGALGQTASTILTTNGLMEGGLAAAKKAAPAIAEAGSNALTAADEALGQKIRPTAAQLKDASQGSYEAFAKAGGNIPIDPVEGFVTKAQSILPQTEKAKMAFGENAAEKLVQGLDAYRGSPMTFQEASELDQKLGDFVHGPGSNDIGGLTPEGLKILQVQKDFRNALGNVDGGDLYKSAVKDWAAQAQTRDIQRIIDRAGTMDNGATALKKGFGTIATNSAKLAQFPKDVQIAIKHAANDGNLSNFLRTQLGSRLGGWIAGAAGGGVPGMVVGSVVSGGARDAAEMMQMGRANKVLDAIAANSSIPTQTIPLSERIKSFLSQPPAEGMAAMQEAAPATAPVTADTIAAASADPTTDFAVALQKAAQEFKAKKALQGVKK